MSRNTKPEYIKKLFAIKTNNGFKVDVANYLHNPSPDQDYPTLKNEFEVTEGMYAGQTMVISFGYYKHYDGTGEYLVYTHYIPKETSESGWYIAQSCKQDTLISANRFSMKKLIELTEKYGDSFSTI